MGNTSVIKKTNISIELESLSFDILCSHDTLKEVIKPSSDYYIA